MTGILEGDCVDRMADRLLRNCRPIPETNISRRLYNWTSLFFNDDNIKLVSNKSISLLSDNDKHKIAYIQNRA